MTRRRVPVRSRWRRQVRRFGISLLFVVVGSGLWYTQERDQRDQLVWMGVPTWEAPTPLTLHRVLRNDGFLVGWSDVRVNPLWVSYLLHEVEDPSAGPRPDFRRDWRTLWPIAADSYFGSGYDRGHLAPNYAIAVVHGREAQRDTFAMSNMSPQRPNLNRRLWQRLEEVVIDRFVPRFGVVQVITGPVFPERFLDNVFNRVGFVEIPEAFYKIIVVPAVLPRTHGGMGAAELAQPLPVPQHLRGRAPGLQTAPVHERPEVGVALRAGHAERSSQLVAVVDLGAAWRQQEAGPRP